MGSRGRGRQRWEEVEDKDPMGSLDQDSSKLGGALRLQRGKREAHCSDRRSLHQGFGVKIGNPDLAQQQR